MRWIREAALWLGALAGVGAVVAAIMAIGFGHSFLVFRSGSMGPQIPTGSLAVARPVDAADLQVGDVVSVENSRGATVTHRIVSIDGGAGGGATLTLQGDGNRTPDDQTYRVSSAPRVIASVPYAGYAVAALMTPGGVLVVGAAAVALWVAGSRSDRRHPRGRHAAGPVALAVVAATTFGGTDATFTDPATMTSTSSSAKYFTCDRAMASTANGGLGPWAYYKIDETTPLLSLTITAADASGNGNTAAYRPGFSLLGTNGYVLERTRACGRDTGSAAQLNGSTGYLSSSTNVQAAGGAAGARWNTYTTSMWFKSSSGSSTGNLISMGSSQTGSSTYHDRHVYLTDAGNLVFGVFPGQVREIATSGKDYSDGAWHMVTATLSSAGQRLYVDGQLVASGTTTTAAQDSNLYWRIGYDNLVGWGQTPTSYYFGGTIDEVGIWTRALSATEVSDLYRAGLPTAS